MENPKKLEINNQFSVRNRPEGELKRIQIGLQKNDMNITSTSKNLNISERFLTYKALMEKGRFGLVRNALELSNSGTLKNLKYTILDCHEEYFWTQMH